jgi:AMMECR1 domain-containing protein
MALTEKIEIDRIEIVQDWNIQVRQATIIERDGVFVSKTFHRWLLTPDTPDDVITNQEQKVKDICNTAWTPEVKSAYEAFKIEQENKLGS